MLLRRTTTFCMAGLIALPLSIQYTALQSHVSDGLEKMSEDELVAVEPGRLLTQKYNSSNS